jgi:outer membrane protein TolC
MILILAIPVRTAAAKEIKLTPKQAVNRALKHNLSLQVDRLAPELSGANELAAKAAFDIVLFGETGATGEVDHTSGIDQTTHGEDVTAAVGVRKKFVSGTTVEARTGGVVLLKGNNSGLNKPNFQADLSVSVRQSILQGARAAVNKSDINTARLAQKAARLELRRKAELIAAKTLVAYWDLYAALANLKVQQVALKDSKRTYNETVVLARAGKLAHAEKIPNLYLVQTHRRDVILAQKEVANARDKLARLMGMLGPRSMATPRLVPVGRPATALPRLQLKKLQETALKRRGDLQASRVTVDAKKVKVRAARDLLLPKLDLVASVGVTGFKGDPSNTGSTTDPRSRPSSRNLAWSVGVVLEVPLGWRAAKAQTELAELAVRRARASVKESTQSISEELNVAWRAVQSAWEVLKLNKKAVELARIKLKNEMDRYRNRKTSAQIIIIMQAELIKEKLNLQNAVAKFNQALVELRAASGTLVKKFR